MRIQYTRAAVICSQCGKHILAHSPALFHSEKVFCSASCFHDEAKKQRITAPTTNGTFNAEKSQNGGLR